MNAKCASHRLPVALVTTVAVLSLVSGCKTEHSSNPLSPDIAGPIAGVSITAPPSIEPTNGSLIDSTEQPISLTFDSATSNSVRPFSYEVQLAADPDFAQLLLELANLQPSDAGRVTITLSQTLESDKVYYWRVRAADGANIGPYSITGSFELYIPVEIEAPKILGPTGGETVPSNTPDLAVTNALISGPATEVRYRFELSTEPSLSNLSAVLTVDQSSGETTVVSPGALPHDQMFYWRARVTAEARNGKVTGPWTPTASFRTPPLPVTITPPTPTSPINGTPINAARPTLVAVNGIVTGPAGNVTYQFEVDNDTSFSSPVDAFAVPRSSSGTTSGAVTVDLTANVQYFWRVRGTNGDITSSWSGTATFLRTAPVPPSSPPPGGPPAPPAPNPTPGGQLPLPDMSHVVDQVAAQDPGALANSCQDQGGSWEFMDLVVEELRRHDGRWGYNCKRGDCNDVSQDVVDYHFGAGSPDGSTQVYIIDIIGGHCGPDPGAAWIDQTEATRSAGSIGRFKYPR